MPYTGEFGMHAKHKHGHAISNFYGRQQQLLHNHKPEYSVPYAAATQPMRPLDSPCAIDTIWPTFGYFE